MESLTLLLSLKRMKALRRHSAIFTSLLAIALVVGNFTLYTYSHAFYDVQQSYKVAFEKLVLPHNSNNEPSTQSMVKVPFISQPFANFIIDAFSNEVLTSGDLSLSLYERNVFYTLITINAP